MQLQLVRLVRDTIKLTDYALEEGKAQVGRSTWADLWYPFIAKAGTFMAKAGLLGPVPCTVPMNRPFLFIYSLVYLFNFFQKKNYSFSFRLLVVGPSRIR